MIIALLALAFAMILGGLLAAFVWMGYRSGRARLDDGDRRQRHGARAAHSCSVSRQLSRSWRRSRTGCRSSRSEFDARSCRRRAAIRRRACRWRRSPAALVAGSGSSPTPTRSPSARTKRSPLFRSSRKRSGASARKTRFRWPSGPRSRGSPSRSCRSRPGRLPAPAPLREEDETDMKVPDFLLAERDRDTDEEPRVMDGADIYQSRSQGRARARAAGPRRA